MVIPLAGSGTPSFFDATGSQAGFNEPYDVAVDVNGNVFVADRYNCRIRKISSVGGKKSHSCACFAFLCQTILGFFLNVFDRSAGVFEACLEV